MGEWLREMLKLKGKMLSCFLQFPCFVGLSVLKCVLQSQQRYTNKMEAKVGANRKCSAQKQTQNKDTEMSWRATCILSNSQDIFLCGVVSARRTWGRRLLTVRTQDVHNMQIAGPEWGKIAANSTVNFSYLLCAYKLQSKYFASLTPHYTEKNKNYLKK